MSQHRLAAGRMYPGHAVLQTRPSDGHMARPAALEELAEGTLQVPGMALLTEIAGEMQARDRRLAGQLLGAGIGTGDAAGFQTPADVLGADLASSPQIGKARLQLRIRCVDIEPEDVQGLVLPAGGDLNPRHE